MTAKKASPRSTKHILFYGAAAVIGVGGFFALGYSALPSLLSVSYGEGIAGMASSTYTPPGPPPLDKAAYDTKLLELAHVATTSPWYYAFLQATTTITMPGSTTTITVAPKSWPARAAYPADGRALLPFNRIVAYYGNFYSRNMGVLGQYDPEEMLVRLASTTQQWRDADPNTPVIPAIHYIVEVAQGSPGKDGKYVGRMPDDQVEKALDLAKQINGLVFLDFQVGLSDLPSELPLYEKYLKLPNVHLGIDPEFAMKTSGYAPGKYIGTYDAADVNYAAQYLATLVRENNLPPKILIVHRFTEDMITNYQKIEPLPEVQIVMDMDGWGDQQKKIGTYTYVIAAEPVQFTGFKLFYKNDLLPPSTGMLSPAQVLNLTPAPVYIQYQ
jgi:hypothetical protein